MAVCLVAVSALFSNWGLWKAQWHIVMTNCDTQIVFQVFFLTLVISHLLNPIYIIFQFSNKVVFFFCFGLISLLFTYYR